MSMYTCSRCPRHFDTVQAVLDHDCSDDDTAATDTATDGGTLTLDGQPKARVQYSSGGIQFCSEPLDFERAREYADALGDAVVKVDSGERPLCDDEQARIVPEVEQR